MVAELKKEIARLKESNSRLNQHTSEIESRLARSEDHSSTLLTQVEQHEAEVAKRQQAYEDLERRLAVLLTSQDNKVLTAELAEKNQRILTLEGQLSEQASLQMERDQLRITIQEEQAAGAELRAKLNNLSVSTSTTGSSSREPSSISFDDAKEALPQRSPVPTIRELTPPDSPGSVVPLPQDQQVFQLETALRELAAKYHEAEHHIADLTTQLSEAKLIHAELDDILPTENSPPTAPIPDDDSETGTPSLQTPKGPSPAVSPSRSTNSRRGSQTVPPSGGTVAVKPKDFRAGRGSGESQRARPQSLSQELSSAQSLDSLRASWTGPSALKLASSPSRQSLPVMQQPLRTSQSLEAELKFVHEVSRRPRPKLMIRWWKSEMKSSKTARRIYANWKKRFDNSHRT